MGKAGAELVSDVIPFEEMKLRMLNGSHSFLAYLGYLAVTRISTTVWKTRTTASPRTR